MNPYTFALIVFLVVAILGVAIWLLALACSPSGQHARPHEGRHEFADRADRIDPYGEAYVTALREDGWWEQHAPRPSRVEVLTGPGTQIRQTSEVTAAVLARGTGQFPMLPPDPDPDPTLIQPADVRYLGKPSGEYVDELFARHAAAEGADLASKYLTAEVSQ